MKRAILPISLAASLWLGTVIGLYVSPTPQTIIRTDPACDAAKAQLKFDTQHPELKQALENER